MSLYLAINRHLHAHLETYWQWNGPTTDTCSYMMGRHEPPPVPTYIFTGCYTDWVWPLVTTISCRLVQSNGSLTCLPKMHHRHALYDSRRVTDRLQQCTASLATHAVLGSLHESYRGFVSYRNQYREIGALRCHTETYW